MSFRAVRFVSWTVASLTLPAHASLFTGLWPQAHGVRVNGAHRLPDDVPTLAESGFPGFESYVWASLFVRAETPEGLSAASRSE